MRVVRALGNGSLEFGLVGTLRLCPYQLSGGQQERVAGSGQSDRLSAFLRRFHCTGGML